AAALAAERAVVEFRLAKIAAELEDEDDEVPTLVRTVKNLDAKLQDLLRREAAARQREINPRSAVWSEAQTLLSLAQDEPRRLRLRALLQQMIEAAWVLIVPRRSHRLLALQVHFKGGARRDYFIHYRAAGFCREGGSESASVVWQSEGK